MKKIFCMKWLSVLMLGATLFSACNDDVLVETSQAVQEDAKDTYVATLIAGLSEEEAKSRLAYELESNGGIKMTWAERDQLAVNALQGDTYWTYKFDLTSGAGTNQGTFSEPNMSTSGESYNWTLYYPGTTITNEQEWYNVSYLGQTQRGNNNIEHLKDFHSIRLPLGNVDFNNTYIDFSGDDVDESMCMKFNFSNFPTCTPTKIELAYINPNGGYETCFHTSNYLDNEDYIWGYRNGKTVSRMPLSLEGFSSTTSLTAYMMMSNYPINVQSGGKFRVYLTTSANKKYYSDVAINANVTLMGSHLYSITAKNWNETGTIDAFDYPSGGVTVLREATLGDGVDIIIMGDGFNSSHFGDNGDYDDVMIQAYEDFFSVEPYASLENYFNVYYVNAVSEEDHDATPQENGATMGDAVTIFNTQFIPGTTSISGNNSMVLEYAMQAIRTKGGDNGSPVTDEDEVYRRAHTALMMVQVNVACHAGTCGMVWSLSHDYGYGYSVAYTALNTSPYGRKWTTIHEAGGHGFGKLADEYSYDGNKITSFSTGDWAELNDNHSNGVYRNVNEYWGDEERQDGWSLNYTDTNNENVYWSALLNDSYGYRNTLTESGKGEGLGIYRGAKTYPNLYCRPTDNSVMNNQFGINGNFFNAISRWAIWYRVMMLSGTKSYSNFASSLNEFITFDETLTINKNITDGARSVLDLQNLKPLAPPVRIKASWINGRLVEEK